VPSVRVDLAGRAPLDYADALAPGVESLPLTLGPGRNTLLRVERCRMLTAAIASAAGLAPVTVREWRRGPRGVGVPQLATRPRVMPGWAAPAMFIASVVALALLTNLGFKGAFAITAGIGIHELGHAIAMRVLGVGVRGVLFVPLLGGATVPEHSFRSRWDEARIALAGPVTALPTAGVLFVVWKSGVASPSLLPLIAAALAWTLLVNLLNLVPVIPLDGGRVLTCLAAGLPPVASAIVCIAPLVAVVGVLIFVLPDSVLIPAGIFVGIAFSITKMTLRRQAIHAWMRALPQSGDALRAALRDVTFGLTGRAREDADGGVAPTPLSVGQTFAVLGIYGAEILALFVAASLVVRAFPKLTEFLAGGG
jgi:Zn-dependent protease